MASSGQAPPLDGITVLDLTIALAGPYATQLLAALGATVIKIENPAGGDPARGNAPYLGRHGLSLARRDAEDVSVSMLERGRNKLSVTLNLKHPTGREIFLELARRADAVVENFSAGTADRLGVGYEVVRAVNERVVYTSISGFGAGRPGKGMDTIFQALSGLMLMAGVEGDPPVRSGVPFGDLVGPLFAVIGTLAALQQRERTGRGQRIDVSLLGALTALAATEPWETMERAGIPMRTGNTVPRLAPFGIFPTSDGYIALCAPTEAFARGVLAAIGRAELAEDERFASRDARVAHARELHGEIERWTRTRPTAAAVAALEEAGVPVAVVRGPAEAVRDPAVRERGETVPLVHPELGELGDVIGSGFPVRFSEARVGYHRPAPRLGEHNEAVYGELLGFDAERLATLRSEGVI